MCIMNSHYPAYVEEACFDEFGHCGIFTGWLDGKYRPIVRRELTYLDAHENGWSWTITRHDGFGEDPVELEYRTNDAGRGLFFWVDGHLKQEQGFWQFELSSEREAAIKQILDYFGAVSALSE